MINTFFAKRMFMSGKFTPKGDRVGVSVLEVPTMKIVGSRTIDKHGYDAIIVEFKHQGKTKTQEIRTDEKIDPGTEVSVSDLVNAGDKVNVSGITKGKGFAGAVKRHNFRGGPRTHGQSDRERAPGSSGSTTTPGRVFKGKRRAGHMGVDRVMVRNLSVFEVNPETNTVTVTGSVPGASRYTLLKIEKAK